MTARPRAAVFCRTFLPYTETFVYDELRSHERWDVDVFTRERIEEGRFPYRDVFTPGGPVRKAAYRATTYSPEFARLLHSRGARLVHAHFGTSAVYAHTYHRLLGLPLIVTFHGYDVGALVGTAKLAPKRWRYWALARTILSRASLLLCASQELCELVNELSRRPDAVRLYRLGIDLSRFHPRPRASPARVIMVGRFVEKKGHIDGIEAFARVVKRGARGQLVIVGSGPLEPAYRALIQRHGIEARVDIVGPKTQAEVAALVAESTVMMAPCKVARDGDRDSGILVVKEAGACEVPSIGTSAAGIPEIIDDAKTGFIVPPSQPALIAERLHQLLGDPDLVTRMGRAARVKVKREYDLRARVRVLEDYYDEVSGATPARTT